ncbi:4-hydroxythreonine-4-phosphate dehydrogenase PdxA [Marivirga arenosa]|uniref:4-hydroxythreonine-4-phosphate dehydrogenase PdxA n=1 Tax=Marivirga arenosa TaxID=3059076 RepID=A0AA51ZVH8_9BACT|nr:MULTISPECIES: 4-hydroxythreonine-4-phosphate dehydrogenase PdxA [unclassified Marivirga]WMN06167.1 4-hydroxythreonine-4-phosphate dehydrogenase PdxA [Marivirga sp. ABR2-2]WNB17503.1 4-hydroxythreonine-4-phosphate dehydrogenase PdxA [Marivirga sp. BKB1-2]
MEENNKPTIAITIGDVNSIAPEVIIKALEDNRILKLMTPVVYGSGKILSYYRKALNIRDFNYFQLKKLEELNDKKLNVLNLWEETVNITMGQSTEEAGKYAFISIEKAVDDALAGNVDAIVTAPINKNNIQSDNFNFAGHTEYLAQKSEVKDSLMLLVDGDLRVGVVTGHIPIQDVANKVTAEKIDSKLDVLEKSLKQDFGIKKPKIAVLGLNPHAGDGGVIGNEEEDFIKPLIEKRKEKGKLVFGPFPADGFFGNQQYKNFDAVLAMYHDQGLIPFKTLAFSNGVNYTAGLPFVRTSPDHGTAYDLTGKGQADETSMRQALFLASDIIKNRKEYS